ncbi:MAG: restriction endonuclease subunit S [Seleniivibrio sp.]|nr:restriction endonuclease subunit S [Seleniivibrio sp.]
MFEINSYQKRFDANKVEILESGKYPYVVRMGSNNGQRGFINEDTSYLNEGNTISFGQDTATMFYQEIPYFTGDKIKILKAKNKKFSKKNAQFFISAMTKSFASFSWGSSSFSVEIIKKQKAILPVLKNGEIDFEFMESFIAELEAERIAELEAYLAVTNLKDYTLTTEEKQVLSEYDKCIFKEYNLIDIFEIKNTGNILSRDIVENSGKIPYLCASAENNAVSSYIAYDNKYLDKGNCIFIGGKTFTVTYQEHDFFSNDSHNLVLYLKDNTQQIKLNQLFLATCVAKSLSHKYSWGDSVSNKKIQKDTASLPTLNDKPDYAKMGTLISAIQKLVIKDVVEYADKKISATKTVISG